MLRSTAREALPMRPGQLQCLSLQENHPWNFASSAVMNVDVPRAHRSKLRRGDVGPGIGSHSMPHAADLPSKHP